MSDMDLIVVGGGMAGLVAATRAAELGLRVAVVEQGTEASYLCNTRLSGGALHLGYASMSADAATIARAIENCTAGYADPGLARTLSEESSRIIAWLKTQGAKFMRGGQAGYQQYMLAPPIPNDPGLNWRGRAGDVLLRTLETHLVKLGGRVIRGCRAEELSIGQGGIDGIVARSGESTSNYQAAVVILADGGFQSDPDMVRRHISPAPEKLKQRGAGTGLGFGARMAAAAGAKLAGLESFYGHLLCRDALTNDRLWPHPVLDFIAAAGVVIDSSGRRFADEGQGGIHVANCVARLADPLSAFVVFDDRIWNGAPGRSKLVPPNPYIETVGATVHVAGRLDELARAIDVPELTFIETVERYNQAVKQGTCTTLVPPRTTGQSFTPYPLDAYAIEIPPFRAIPLCAGITYTMGGIAIDENARVLRARGGVIEGLYAAGAATAGIEGGPYAGYVGGLAKAAIFGLRAAEAASKYLTESRTNKQTATT